MKVFMDMEFTGLHRDTTIVSIGLVAEDGQTFYRETNDYNDKLVDEWINDNVMKHLNWVKDENRWDETVNHYQLTIELEEWLNNVGAGDPLEFWLDTGAYDWMLFCDLWGGALKVPAVVHYIPRDLSTFLYVMGIDPDINRSQFAGMEAPPEMGQHHALWDALVMKACVEELEKHQYAQNALPEHEDPPPEQPGPEDVPETDEPPEEQPPPEDEVPAVEVPPLENNGALENPPEVDADNQNATRTVTS